MKLLKKKVLSVNINKISEKDIKVQLNSKSVENKKKERKCDLIEKKK